MLWNIIMTALRGGGIDFWNVIVALLASLLIIFVILPIHECAHGLTAYALGDDTAKRQGRLTLNPLSHIDYLGAFLLLLVGFGWANPVPVNPRRMTRIKNEKAGMAITALAGPLANLLVAFIGSFLWCFFVFAVNQWLLTSISYQLFYYVQIFFANFVQINIYLALFNLIPIPPLDGSKILMAFLPDRICTKIYMHQSQISLIFFIVLIMGFNFLAEPLSELCNIISNFMVNVASLPFGL
ncbi:MAG: site-2 protease family protein [Acutalibacteraceae bacterium]